MVVRLMEEFDQRGESRSVVRVTARYSDTRSWESNEPTGELLALASGVIEGGPVGPLLDWIEEHG